MLARHVQLDAGDVHGSPQRLLRAMRDGYRHLPVQRKD